MKINFPALRKLITVLLLISGFTANATTYYVSNSGSDNNSGLSTTTPWKTLDKVNSFTGLVGGDAVLFNRGEVFYGKLIMRNSGLPGKPITFGAYGSGAAPVITGLSTVSAWTNLGGNIWESTATVSALSSINMVTINGINTPMGRFPNTGYLTFNSHSTNTSITSSSLTGSPNWTGAEVVIRKSHWVLDRCLITGQSGSTLYYKSPSIDNAQDGYGFFIQNDSRTLDLAGEWYYNPSTKKIRIYSISLPAKVQVATVDTLVYDPQKNYLTFDNLSFQGSNVATFQLYACQNISIQNCNIDFSGATALQCRMAVNTTIQNNTINHSNDFGVKTDIHCTNAYIGNNMIKNTGRLAGMGAAASRFTAIMTYGSNSVIEYNELDSTGFMGINFLGSSTVIRNNLINFYCTVIDDGGGIYMFNLDNVIYSGIKITNNILLYGMGAPDGTANTQTSGEGIYLDDNGNGIEISGNTVANCGFAGIFIHSSYNNQILNNTIYNNNYVQIYLRHDQQSPLINNIMKGNIFISKTESQPVLLFSTVSNDFNLFGIADSNYYARPINDNLTFKTDSTGTAVRINRTLTGWQLCSGLDVHSKKSPKAITTLNDLRFEYNATRANKTITLDGNYIDVKNVSYNGTITLAPYTSAILIRNGAAKIQLPTAQAGSDQTITLPTSTVTLSGSGTDADGTIAAYNWTKISGPTPGTITSPASASTTVTALVQGVYTFQLKVTDNAGNTGLDTVQVTANAASVLLPAVNPANAVNGLDYKYYESNSGYSVVPVFSTLTPVKTGTTTNYNISLANRSTTFSFNFTGFINVPSDGQYTFYTTSDDGSNLYIDNVPVVNNDGTHGATEKSGTIGLKAGKHAISVGYFQQGGGGVLTVSYSGPGVSKQAMPASALYRISTSGLIAGNTEALGNNINQTITSSTQVSIKAYPNPFANYIEISIASDVAGEYKLMLVDAPGRVVWTSSGIKNAGTFQKSINTSTLERGFYFLKVIQNNTSSVIKLVK